MAYESRPLPRQNEVDRTGEMAAGPNLSAMRPSVAEAVGRLPRLPRRPNGIFKHPNDWTEEEINVIVDALKMNVPVYTIANLVHCERHTLSKLIAETPELRQLKEEQQENLYEEAIYQADRLAKAGNASIVMFILERLGKNKGWNQVETAQESGGEEGRIVMGVIPDNEVEAADAIVKERQAQIMPKSALADVTNPQKLAMTQEAVDEMSEIKANEIVAERMAAMPKMAAGAVGNAPYKQNEQLMEQVQHSEVENYGNMGGGMAYGEADPYADGADSMFMQ